MEYEAVRSIACRWTTTLTLIVFLATKNARATCPSRCVCNSEDVVDCSDSGIADVPTNIPSTATTIDLSYNSISGLKKDDFENASNWQSLDLSNNKISEIGNGTFEVFENLQFMNLSSNTIQGIPQETFAGLNGLKTLDLSFNPAMTLIEGALQIMPSLTSISLSGCPTARSYKFSDIGTLQHLLLTQCEIHTLQPDNFRYLGELVLLDLSDNKITDFPSETIGELRKLEVLHMDRNDVDLSKGKLLSQFSAITNLTLDENEIRSIHQETLHDMRQLQQLSLVDNKLRSLPESMFNGIPVTGSIDLDLAGNPLNCDCNLRWMTSWIRDNNVDDVVCDAPYAVQYKQLRSLKADELACVPWEVPGQHIYHAVEGDDVTMICPLYTDEYTVVTWSTDCGEVVEIPSTIPFTPPYSIDENHSLVISKVTKSLCETYICEAQTSAGSLSTELTLNIKTASNDLHGVVVA
ncbi:Leucine-rich repeat and immunoglobulin-like domain-containing nogo receptor-interacting protein 1 [Holothuria leucospilota]|uniref:Leucine-rich repeat and immunoglobulin-like domain-containing nogo receptor-interacting protein 1 n=1 Tax=Holothuria leucospilota TaxID=206669 RepID=A0A9Q0YTE0_HOLLE|nr:Leucine-rich repeat and immunoglobulin-like domain-containing nogo receptor-interacting protein 1 [Holothuria leucospilota]